MILGDAAVGGSTAADVAVAVAEHHGNLPDNQTKLGTADGDERHLFIWVESDHHQVVAAMGLGVLPERPPALPDQIDVVWLATALRPSHVWRHARGAGWQDLGAWRLDDG